MKYILVILAWELLLWGMDKDRFTDKSPLVEKPVTKEEHHSKGSSVQASAEVTCKSSCFDKQEKEDEAGCLDCTIL